MACVAAAGMIREGEDPLYLLHHNHIHMECERPRKRPKLSSSAWDVLPFSQQAEAPPLPLPFRGIGITSSSSSSAAREGERERAPLDHHHNLTFNGNAKAKGKGVSASSPPWRPDDKDGHYTFALGENLTPRYKILSKMGEGTFGQVLECWDRQTKQFVAVKIARGLQKYCDAAMIEIDVLSKVAKHDKTGTRCVQMLNWFDYRNHICIVFEKLGPSLYDFVRKNNYHPFPIDLVRELGRQLLGSVACVCTILVLKDFLSHDEWRAPIAWWFFLVFCSCIACFNMHDLHLVHTDLKPENVLLVSSGYVKVPDNKNGLKLPSHGGLDVKRLPKSSAIKLIDFGSTTFEHQDHSSVVSTRHYRAPEVILGLGWSYPCDIWSVGCILVELCTGETLFQTHENLEHLAMMERVLGLLPVHMIKKADRHYAKYFRHRTRLDWPEGASSRESIRAVRRLLRLPDLIIQHVDKSAALFIDLLEGLLKFEARERLTASEALRHPFFTEK